MFSPCVRAILRPFTGPCFNIVSTISLFQMLLLVMSLAGTVGAQTTSTVDFNSPRAMEPGSPAGAYSLSDLESIDIYSGRLSVSIPLLEIGGRGSRRLTIPLEIDGPGWMVLRNKTGPDVNGLTSFYYQAAPRWVRENAEPIPPPAPGGLMIGKHMGVDTTECGDPDNQTIYYRQTRTTITFIAPDGTQYEMRDQLRGGSPITYTCFTGETGNRGNVFSTKDGTAATFISDIGISDVLGPIDGPTPLADNFRPSGYLFLRDGTCYRIYLGSPQWIRDPNGNMINFYYTGPFTPPYKIADSLNREVFFDFSSNSVYPYWRLNQIRFKGFGGTSRTIKIFYANLGSVLRSGYSLLSPSQLFPEMDSIPPPSAFPEDLVSSVQLPNGRSYQFRYNPYRELARVTLPTGGAIEYDYEGGELNGTTSGVVGSYRMFRSGFNYLPPQIEIHRRLVQRRVYPDGATLANTTTYSKVAYGNDPFRGHIPSGGIPQTSSIVVTMHEGGTSGQALSKSQHFFHHNPIAQLLTQIPLYDSYWNEGKEYQTDTINPDNSAVLRRIQNTWVDAYMPSGPRITETTITLMDVDKVAKQTFNYDLYNNVTDVYEYDFGSEEDPGPLLRHTHTDYLTNNPDLGDVNYATNLNVHMRNLPTQQQTFNESGTEVARTTYEYDKYTGANHAPLVDLPGISAMYPGYTSAYPIRGNVTKVSRWLLPSTEISTYSQYDTAGNVVKTIDGRTPAGITTFDYSDLFGSPTGGAHTNIPPTELGQQKSYAFPTKVTNALGHETHTKYDYYLGKPVDRATERPGCQLGLW